MTSETPPAETVRRTFEAIKAGRTDEVRELVVEDARLAGARGEDGLSTLAVAGYHGKKEIVALLLEKGANPDVFDAAILGLDEAMGPLLKGNRDLVRSYSADGWTPLHLAAHFDRVSTVKLLIRNGADHRAVSKNAIANQPLQAAIAGRATDAALVLLDAGAEPDARSHGQATGLHLAAQNGDTKVTVALLDRGADVNALTEGGKTPLDFAEEKGHEEVARLLKDRGAARSRAAKK